MLASIRAALTEEEQTPSVSNELLSQLRKEAFSALRLNRSPVTGFTVLASVESITGNVYGGTNIEVVSLSLTKHAEEVAVIAGLLDQQDPEAEWIRTVYVAGATPCGSCRQFLWEWATENTVCILESVEQEEIKQGRVPEASLEDERISLVTLGELFPSPFPAAGSSLHRRA